MSNLTKSYETAYFFLEPQQDVAIVHITKRRLSEEDNMNQLGFELMNIVEQHGFQKVIMSLQDVDAVTSSVLGKMIRMHRHLERIDGKMIFCNLTESVHSIMETSRLNTYFTIRDNIEQATADLH